MPACGTTGNRAAASDEAAGQDSRKWRRRAPLLCLLLLLFIALVGAFAYHREVRRYTEQGIRAVRQRLERDGQVCRAFGRPVQVGERPKAGADGDYTFEVTGTSGHGEVDVQVRQTQGGWEHRVTGVRKRKGKDGEESVAMDVPGGEGDGGAPDAGNGPFSQDPNGTTNAGETFDFNTIRFSGGKRSKIIEAIEQVVGRDRVRASTRFPPGGPAWTCVTVDGKERLCLMDPAWTLDDFPELRAAGFQPVQGPVAKTLSIYRSLTLSTMNYQLERGDRVVVLVCPKSDWETLQVPWPQ